jgi:four helix bundle protein
MRKRRYPAHFVSKLTDADGENSETQHWLRTAEACGYLTEDKRLELLDRSGQIGSKLGTMIRSPRKWLPRDP